MHIDLLDIVLIFFIFVNCYFIGVNIEKQNYKSAFISVGGAIVISIIYLCRMLHLVVVNIY